jgi:hypothetical protein
MVGAMTTQQDFDGAFRGLRRMLLANAKLLRVKTDAPDDFSLETEAPMRNGERLWVAAVKKNKNYVSFHFVPVYMYPDLLRKISPQLKKRMQGKGCFNFKAPDRDLLDELAKLVRAGTDALMKRGLPA